MKRRSVLAAVLALSWGGTGLAVATEPSTLVSACRVHELPLPPGAIEASVWVVDPSGHWRAGVGDYAGKRNVALVWHDDEVLPLIVPSAWSDPYISAIAKNGDLVGRGTLTEYGVDPFARIDNTIVRLSAPGFLTVNLTGIDERGHIVGTGDDAAGYRRPLRWDVTAPDDPQVIDLPYPPQTGIGVATNARGTIVISPTTLPTTEKLSYVISPNGRQRVLRGIKGGGGAAALRISGHWVGGSAATTPSGGYIPVRWDLSNGAKVESFDDAIGGSTDIDSRGRLSGYLDTMPSLTVITDRVTTTILEPLEPEGVNGVFAMSSQGHAVGYSKRDDLLVPVEWTCNFS